MLQPSYGAAVAWLGECACQVTSAYAPGHERIHDVATIDHQERGQAQGDDGDGEASGQGRSAGC